MSRKILGLDIGSHSIKAVLVKEGFGKIEPVRYIEKPRINGDVQGLIRSIFQEAHLKPDIVVSSVAGTNVSVHYLQIPFSDESKISRVVPNEVENLIPFHLEDMVIDQVILSKGNGAKPSGGGSSVCVALIKKQTLQHHIDMLKEASVDSKIIELESLAFYHAFMQWNKTEDTVALLDIGAERSNLCIVAKGKPVSVRTFTRGGDSATAAIKDACGGSMEEAEERKLSSEITLSRVIVGTELNAAPDKGSQTMTDQEIPKPVMDDMPDEREPAFPDEDTGNNGSHQNTEEIISSAVKKGLSPLVTELMQSIHAYESQNNDEVSKLYISGGGARLRNLEKFLSMELHMDVDKFSIPGEFLQKLQIQADAGHTLSTGIGLALCGTRRKQSTGINFKKGEQISRKESNVNIRRTIYIIAAIITVSILGFADFYYNVHYREERYNAIKKEMRKVFMETFPETKNIVDENQQFKSSVEEMRKKVEALGGGTKGEVTSLDILNVISEKIPKEMQVDVDDIMIDKSKLRVQGETDSFESVEKIKKEFESVGFFKKVDVSDAKLSADQKKVKFRIIIDM
ncbi:MAG: pilus assembly protein PilM [Nitrospirae bacterium]|nr:pilus assembly protein PilM [Nitrospirota bacterium]